MLSIIGSLEMKVSMDSDAKIQEKIHLLTNGFLFFVFSGRV
jgi:hypothetical protein